MYAHISRFLELFFEINNCNIDEEINFGIQKTQKWVRKSPKTKRRSRHFKNSYQAIL